MEHHHRPGHRHLSGHMDAINAASRVVAEYLETL